MTGRGSEDHVRRGEREREKDDTEGGERGETSNALQRLRRERLRLALERTSRFEARLQRLHGCPKRTRGQIETTNEVQLGPAAYHRYPLQQFQSLPLHQLCQRQPGPPAGIGIWHWHEIGPEGLAARQSWRGGTAARLAGVEWRSVEVVKGTLRVGILLLARPHESWCR